ncbi:Cellulose synthase-like protein G3 [Ananas comosus]|uniref:Cellulose synthase-like protein G3 n=1 Tax=Ananas comosus TaxID=4615 RepID=A0A199V5W6_ANACO|nr:Cellulose synthase-like protein G3 [Ananas comosus]
MLVYSVAVLVLLCHRTASLAAASKNSFSSFVIHFSLLFADSILLSFMWACSQAFRWRPVRRQEFPHRLPDPDLHEWPALDVFVCIADPRKEPPTSVASTALSMMALDYPAHKLSVYVSDDGGSEVTLFAFMEAARFARYWLPFCREKGIMERSPDAYFASPDRCGDSESQKMKMMFDAMKENVGSAMEKGCVTNDFTVSAEERELFDKWKGFVRNNHPSIIKVLLKSDEDRDITNTPLPNLVYLSREKRPSSPHHFKAGALNVLLRVSGIMSNAPIVLTVDCDMYANDPKSPQRALCYFLDPSLAPKLAFVQFPQHFEGLNKHDIYGGEIRRSFRINSYGLDGLRGPDFVGTNCFHSRHALCGSFSPSSNLTNSKAPYIGFIGSEPTMAQVHDMAACDYELGTKWGSTLGFRYGSLVEDYYTGFRLHCEGWESVFSDPARPAFLGDAPKSLHDSLSQFKRWVVGLFEVAFSRYSPLTFGARNASLAMGLGYGYYAFRGIWCIPILTYALLPQLALVSQRSLFPKASEPRIYLCAYLFLAAYGQDLAEFVMSGGSVARWWSDQRMWMIRGVTSFLFGTIEFALNQAGIPSQGFNVTSKAMEEEQRKRYDNEVFDFGIASPFFILLGTTAILNLASFIAGITRAAVIGIGVLDEMFVHLFLAGFIAANCLPIYEALFFRSDEGKMPRNVTLTSIFLAGLLLYVGGFLFNTY